MKKMNLLTLILPICLLLSTTTAWAQPLNVDKTFTGVKAIEISVGVGKLEISASNSDKVEVKGYFKEEIVTFKVAQSGDKLRIIEKKHKNNRNGDNVRWELSVPKDIDMEANLGVGDVDVKDFTGELEGNNGTGNFVLKNSRGDVKWNSGTGDLMVRNSEGEVELNSGTGNVMVSNAKGEVNANSGTGNVKVVDSEGAFKANSGTGNVKAENLKIVGESTFTSGTGGATLVLASQLKADCSVTSGTGNAKVNRNGHDLNGKLVMACDKRRGEIIAPFKFQKERVEGSGKNQTIYKSTEFGDSDVKMKISTGTGSAIVK